jgi:hypothetical protein
MLGFPPGRVKPLRSVNRRFIYAFLLVAVGVVTLGGAAAGQAGTANPLATCAFGRDIPGLTGYLQNAIDKAAGSYAKGLNGADSTTRARARNVFAAAAAAYVYGLPQVTERATVKHFPRNEIVSVATLANPQVQTVVAPNVDTAYTVAWLDLTNGPMVINVPDTGGRFYTFQFLDAFTNAFAYVGTGSTGTKAGAYALVPPGYSGALPSGVTPIDTPSNTVWLLGRTLVKSAADLPAVKALQEHYQATPLTAWEQGVRQTPIVLDQYPPSFPKSIPTGSQFIATLNNEMNIDPPPAADDCALRAMAAAGVQVPHPTAAQSILSDVSDLAPPSPSVAGDPATNAAVSAGTAAAVEIIAAADTNLNAHSRGANNGWEVLGSWVGDYGTRYLPRAIIATNLLGANTPKQSMYPIADTDVKGRMLDGARDYTIRFPKGDLPPVNAFWSLTMYNASYFLYANQIDRYAIGNRTQGLHIAHDGSLTVYVQHDEPATEAERANWLPAPTGTFHLILRLYQPKQTALTGKWKPAPVLRTDESLAPALTRLRISPAAFRPADRGPVTSAHGPARVTYLDSRAAVTSLVILAVDTRARCRPRQSARCTIQRAVVRFSRRDHAGANQFFLTGRAHGARLKPGRYLLRAVAGGSPATPSGSTANVAFRVI